MARKTMSDSELVALLDGQITDAISYDNSDLSSKRALALEYREGIMRDVPAEEGKSSVVSRDVADTIGWIAPGLARVFLSSEHILIYEPQTPRDEPFAKQATDYVNWVFLRDCNGYSVISMAIDDGLLLGNGIVKHWWDETPTYRTERFTGLSEGAFTLLMSDPDIEEALEHSQYPDPSAPQPDPMMAAQMAATGMEMPPPPMLHDVKVRVKTGSGRLRIKALPPEEFLIERQATALNEDECRFCGHRYLETRSNLIKQGYDREIVESVPSYSSLEYDQERLARDDMWLSSASDEVDSSVERVEVFECYTLLDYDGDGVAEWRRIVMAGGTGRRNILENEEWGDDLPFSDLVPDPVPHRWRGRSIFDETQDVQRIKTVLMRQALDNLYLTNNPQREVVEGTLVDPDELLNSRIGGLVRVRAANSIRDMAIPFVAKDTFPVLEYMDAVVEKRTGVSRSTMQLDPQALQNQTATAVQAQQQSAYSKIELYARNLAENGMKRIAKCLLKLIVKHQDKPRAIRLRDDWVDMDPRAWSADMDVTINVGLGAGSRDRDLQMLSGIKQSMELILGQMGPMNPIAPLDKYANVLRKMVEVSGMKSPDQFFNEVGPEEMQKLAAQSAQPKPDPKMMEAQAKLQIEQQKAAADAELSQQRAASELQLQRDKAGAQLEADREAAQLKLQLAREEAAARMQIAREEAQMKAQLRREEMMLEAELTQEANRLNAAVAASRPMDTNLERNP